MTEQEFDDQFVESLDAVLVSMAESPDVDLQKFSSMTYVLENLRFFSPVLFSFIKQKNAEGE